MHQAYVSPTDGISLLSAISNAASPSFLCEVLRFKSLYHIHVQNDTRVEGKIRWRAPEDIFLPCSLLARPQW